MHTTHEMVALAAAERRAHAEAQRLAARLRTVRRLERRAESATRRAQLLRLAIQ